MARVPCDRVERGVNVGKARYAILAIGAVLLAVPGGSEAQQPENVPRIGFLAAVSHAANSVRFEAFREGLRELGYVEGKNIRIEWRYADGKPDRLPALAAELVHLKVDVIVTGGSTATRPAKDATRTIPIVMAQDTDPVGNGFVSSLARPGGNITGLATLAPELSGKQLELMKEMVPKLSHVAVLGTSTRSGNAQSLKEAEHAARVLGVKLRYLDILSAKDIEPAFQAAAKGGADGVLVLTSPFATSQRTTFTGLAARNRLPAIYDRTEFVEDGGLMTYSVSSTDLFRRAATYADKILKGAKPADLPVEQPKTFELAINARTARALGLTVPPSLFLRADRVIE
jgi:ABC-type uncharacterized transport system substrate-binding protein